MYGYSWYKSDITRTDSLREHLRHHDGAFVVRKSTKVVTKPYTLDVRFENNEFHIPIRQREDGKYAMGNYKEHENVCMMSFSWGIRSFMFPWQSCTNTMGI